jgi:MFS family permease
MEAAPPGRWVLPVILSASFLYGFDLNVVNVAIPSLQRDLHAGQAALELVAGGYAFTYAAGLVTGGRLGDMFGYRRMFLAGMAAFAVASALCGLAGSPAQLVGARLLQGLAAALMVPQVLAMITAVYPGGARPRALAWFGAVMAGSGIVGQVLGGLLLTADVLGLGWRAIFFVGVPVAAAALAIASRVLPRTAAPRGTGLDPVGVVAVTGALALALAPLALGREEGWPVWAWAALALAVPAMGGALWWERRFGRRGGRPLLDLSLFRDRSFRVGLGIAAAFMAAFISSIFVLSLLLQAGLGLSATQAGLVFAPMAVVGIAAPLAGRRLISAYGAPRVVLLGSVVSAAGMAAIGAVLRVTGGVGAVGWVVAALVLIGVGNMLVMPALLGAALANVGPGRAGAASGALNTAQQFAGSAGLAVIGTVFFSVLGPGRGAGAYAGAAGVAVWIALGLIGVMAVLAVALIRAARPSGAGAPVERPAPVAAGSGGGGVETG